MDYVKPDQKTHEDPTSRPMPLAEVDPDITRELIAFLMRFTPEQRRALMEQAIRTLEGK